MTYSSAVPLTQCCPTDSVLSHWLSAVPLTQRCPTDSALSHWLSAVPLTFFRLSKLSQLEKEKEEGRIREVYVESEEKEENWAIICTLELSYYMYFRTREEKQNNDLISERAIHTPLTANQNRTLPRSRSRYHEAKLASSLTTSKL